MSYIVVFGLILGLLAIGVCCWLCWQLVQQNGRLQLRLEAVEKGIEHFELAVGKGQSKARKEETETDPSLFTSAPTGDEDQRAERFSSRSLASSKIKRDGLKAGTVAPEFRLPRLDGGELALSELRGRFVLLVFSSPHCGPCNILAPKLEKFHRKNQRNASSPSPRPSPPGEGETASAIDVVMISQGESEENRAKVEEHRLTFPVVLQKQWEFLALTPSSPRRFPISSTRPAPSPLRSPWAWTPYWT
jgi:thiol-disulfide isomerase/thioredoxin